METLQYSIIIQWSDEDNKYIATIPELAGCKTHGSTYEEALQNGKEVIELWLDTAQELGESIPQPNKYAA